MRLVLPGAVRLVTANPAKAAGLSFTIEGCSDPLFDMAMEVEVNSSVSIVQPAYLQMINIEDHWWSFAAPQ